MGLESVKGIGGGPGWTGTGEGVEAGPPYAETGWEMVLAWSIC